jgi:hypothetical protein
LTVAGSPAAAFRVAITGDGMMDAKVTKAFDGVPDGQVMTRRFAIGETVSGDLARVAVENGWAKTPSKGRKRKADADEAGAGDADGSDEGGGAEASGDTGSADAGGEAEASGDSGADD